MPYIARDKITPGVRDLFRVNMGLKPWEAALVLTDQPTREQWRTLDSERLAQMVGRNVLAKMMAEIGSQEFGGSRVNFSIFPATGRSGTEPPPETAREMLDYDVVVAVTNFSITHTDARTAVCRRGGRVASMPGFLAEMFYPGGPMAVDYLQVAEDTQRLAEMLTRAELARVTSAAGTDLTIPLTGRQGMSDDGAYEAPGKWGNLPAGEAYIAPPEGLVQGWLVMEPGWHPHLESTVRLRFEAGNVCAVEGGGGVADHLRTLFALDSDDPAAVSRRNAGELGIGTNPNATSVISTLECEKIRGTVHIGIGDNAHMGGAVSSDSHMDVVINKPDLWLDDKLVIQAGAWLF